MSTPSFRCVLPVRIAAKSAPLFTKLTSGGPMIPVMAVPGSARRDGSKGAHNAGAAGSRDGLGCIARQAGRVPRAHSRHDAFLTLVAALVAAALVSRADPAHAASTLLFTGVLALAFNLAAGMLVWAGTDAKMRDVDATRQSAKRSPEPGIFAALQYDFGCP